MASNRITNQAAARRTGSSRRRGAGFGLRRAVAVVLVVALVAGAGYLAWRTLSGNSAAERVAQTFVEEWERGGYADMWALLTPESQAEIGSADLSSAYQEAARTATLTELEAGELSEEDGVVTVPIGVDTEVFGALSGSVALPVEEERIVWSPELVFPDLAEGETLTRETTAPKRAALLDRKGETLVEGDAEARETVLGDLAGTVGEPSGDLKEELYKRGFPDDQLAGISGLELMFEKQIAGTPGGELRAGERILATSEPQEAEAVRTTLDLELYNAAGLALGDRLGGVAVIDTRKGGVVAVAGDALTSAQPPGSTFKVVTAAAALESGVAKPSTEYPIAGFATIDGFKLKNAHDGELCGGSFVNSFAQSCNSVFGPVGAEIGAERLVDAAERFGVNQDPSVFGETMSTMPAASEFTSDLDVGVTAIGQGQLLMTPLALASIGQTIANGGKRLAPRFDPEATEPNAERAVSRKVAGQVGEMMEAVVTEGTGGLAAVPGVKVAGKTGTAEVGLSSKDDEDEIKDHAWFLAYAPANKPKLAVAVFIANAGFGGDVAAPVASEVLQAGLGVSSAE
ncbi:MAG: hypothetical protein H0U42_02160 [Thermoleophilaceae bacterium]|nr:hypothetical protein [Thermoleophilaceae bacterium]